MGEQHTVYVSGLAKDVSEDDLAERFGSIGILHPKKRIFLSKDKVTGEPKGDALVTYESAAAAAGAVKWFDGSDLKGQKIRVELTCKDQGDLEMQSDESDEDKAVQTPSFPPFRPPGVSGGLTGAGLTDPRPLGAHLSFPLFGYSFLDLYLPNLLDSSSPTFDKKPPVQLGLGAIQWNKEGALSNNKSI